MTDQNSQRLESLAQELEKRRQQHRDGGGHRRVFRKWLRRLLMFAAFAFFVLASVFFFNFFRLNSDLIEGHIKQGIIPNLTQGRFNLQVGRISGNLLRGIDLENILIQNPHFETAGTLLTVPRASLKYSLFDILLGRLVLQKLHVESPILTISRNEKGRGVWDFSTPADATRMSSAGATPPVASENRWQQRDKAQILADQYLEDIVIHNLSILVPAPDRLIKDEFAARLIRLPAATTQFSGIDLSLRKHSAKTFNSHLLRISIPEKSDWLKFQVTTMKENGNFTVSFDALNQNFNFAVDNLGTRGRKINFYDGRQRDRLNLEWVLARKAVSLPEKIRGLTGVIQLSQLSEMTASFLKNENRLSGSLLARFACAADKPLYDAHASLELGSISLCLPYLPVLDALSTRIETNDRRADLKYLNFTVASLTSSHSGFVDFANEAAIFSRLSSSIGGENLALAASYTRTAPGQHLFEGLVERHAGQAEISFQRQLAGNAISYADFKFRAGLQASGSAVDLLPLKLMPEALRQKIDAYLSRVDLLGPLVVSSNFPSLENWRTSAIEIDFSGARVLNRLFPQDSLGLDGKATYDNGLLRLNGFAAVIENLRFDATGTAVIIASSPFVETFALLADVTLPASGTFAMTAERLQKIIGLTNRPDFERIELAGKHIASLKADSVTGISLVGGFDRLRFIRRGKALWADSCLLNADAGWRAGGFSAGTGPVRGAARVEFFGIPVKAEIEAELVSKSLKSLSLSGGGNNFAKILEAIKSQPEGSELFKKHPVDINGAFNFMLLGSGNLQNPVLDGWVKFPMLQAGLGNMNAKLPFHVQLKTTAGEYQAEVKAGDAAIKIKDVTFDLGKSVASLKISGVNASAGAVVTLQAGSSIFGAEFSAAGVIRPAQKRLDNFKLKINSDKIDDLAAGVARIGRFVMPFSLSGKFAAAADLNGPFASPSGKGQINVSRLDLDLPLKTSRATSVLSAKGFSGKILFEKRGDRLFALTLEDIKGALLDASVKVHGKARLENPGPGFKPVIDDLVAELTGLELKKLHEFLAAGLLPREVSQVFQLENGTVSGKFAMQGNPARLTATGTASLRDADIRLPSLPERLKNLRADLTFTGQTDSGFARIAVSDCSASFGRSDFSIGSGWVEDPLKAGKISLNGKFGRVFPADILAMLGGMSVPAVSFPEEGWFDGSLAIAGTFSKPQITAEVMNTAMKVQYNSGQHVFSVPLGKNHVSLSLRPDTGNVDVTKCELELLNGQIVLDQAQGRFLPGKPFTFSLDGKMNHLDFSSFQVDSTEALRGFLGGAFKVNWKESGERDAIFNLAFKDIYVPSLPMLDPKTLAKAGAEFIEKPDFRVGELNFYLTSEEDDELKGRLLIADGLFAGPHLRFELGNSEFNPLAMQLDAKLMINPQSLRQTDIGQKLKKWTVTLQDEKTGVPYVDLSVGGTWDKPALLAKALEKKAVRRVKHNFIGRIFGGHRPHKASVEELMQWFPGWKKGM
ncbi:MAG TPA: hypothetical protein PKM56_06930 [Candidatus Rifleibacterium sp.]|nr:hypothetical protein [Candidatus Rifleibacterium sp.]